MLAQRDLSAIARGLQGRSGVELSTDKLLGHGVSGFVLRGTVRDGTVSAFKIFAQRHEDTRERGIPPGFVREVAILQDLRSGGGHPNVIKLRDVFMLDVREAGVMAYVQALELHHCSLADMVSEAFKTHQHMGLIDSGVIVKLAKGMLSGLAFVHTRGIVHNDIKCSNVLIGGSRENPTAVIADFGNAANAWHGTGMRRESMRLPRKPASIALCGPLALRAPENLQATIEVHDQSEEQKARLPLGPLFPSDVWSLACAIIKMIIGRYPFAEISDAQHDDMHREERKVRGSSSDDDDDDDDDEDERTPSADSATVCSRFSCSRVAKHQLGTIMRDIGPLDQDGQWTNLDRIVGWRRPGLPDALARTVGRMLDMDPEKRITARDAQRMLSQ